MGEGGMEAVILYTTWPDAETARTCAAAAVEAGVCACANILGPMTSVYRWAGAIETAAEIPVLFKTTAARAEACKALILERHPYDLPCVVALPISPAGSHPDYLAWIGHETASPAGAGEA
jgi:periplasmic divalent cation tolerance protein